MINEELNNKLNLFLDTQQGDQLSTPSEIIKLENQGNYEVYLTEKIKTMQDIGKLLNNQEVIETIPHDELGQISKKLTQTLNYVVKQAKLNGVRGAKIYPLVEASAKAHGTLLNYGEELTQKLRDALNEGVAQQTSVSVKKSQGLMKSLVKRMIPGKLIRAAQQIGKTTRSIKESLPKITKQTKSKGKGGIEI